MIGKGREKPYHLTQDEVDYIKSALSMYIEYLRDGDLDEKDMAKKAERLYDKVNNG